MEFKKPTLEVVEFNADDVISTSGDCSANTACTVDGNPCPRFGCEIEGT